MTLKCAVVLAALLFSIGLASAQDKKLDSFNISFASVSGTRAPLWIAKDLGLFEKYGLDGNLVYIASGVTSVNALLGGSVDIIAASGSSAVGAAARGAPLVIIASLGHIAYKLIAIRRLRRSKGLRGKIIGSSRIGAGTDFALQRLVAEIGLTPGKDVTLLPTGISESDRRLLMLVQGKIDATLGTEDNLLQLAARGMKFNVLADVYDAGVYTTGSDIATSRQLLKQKPRQLKAFLMAIIEGTYIGRTQKEVALRLYRKYLKIEDPKMLDSMHKNYLLGSIPARPFPKEEAIQNDIEDLSGQLSPSQGPKGRRVSRYLPAEEHGGRGLLQKALRQIDEPAGTGWPILKNLNRAFSNTNFPADGPCSSAPPTPITIISALNWRSPMTGGFTPTACRAVM